MLCLQKIKYSFKWICNSVIILTVGCVLALCLLNLVNIKYPPLRCSSEGKIDQPDISHPFRGDTIGIAMLLSITFFGPLIQIFVTEWFYNRNPISDPVFYQFNNQNDIIAKYANKDRMKRTLYFASLWYRDYFFGQVFMLLINDLAKSMTNSPRPHYLDSCQPKFNKSDCHMGWLDKYNCTNNNISSWKLTDSHKSFPSGHSALAIFSAIFMIVYQCNRLNRKILGFGVILFLNTAWFSWGIVCSLSRFADRRHHPIDIAIGGLIGALSAIFTTRVISKNFKNGTRRSSGQQGSGISPSDNSDEKMCYSCHNGSASTIVDMIGGSNGSIPSSTNPQGPNGYINNKRFSLKRLLSTSSNMTQMSDIDEGKEMEVLPQPIL